MGFAARYVQGSLVPRLTTVNPALLAAAAFVVIQVTIGIVHKIAQKEDGRYAFSQSASITIAEFSKLCLSAMFFYGQCKQRKWAQAEADQERQIFVKMDRVSEDSSSSTSKKPVDGPYSSASEDAHSRTSIDSIDLQKEDPLASDVKPKWSQDIPPEATRIGPREFLDLLFSEIQEKTAYGMAHLALLYAVVNNSIFVLYLLADPGTISLVRSGITLITALMLLVTVGTRISKGQWLAILFQICGVVVSQYHPGSGTLYGLSTYLLLMFQTTVAGGAGVYNQMLLKAEPGSLHVCNMCLYAVGVISNLIVHLFSRQLKPDEPSFFQGFGSWAAIMVIMSNTLVGLAITAVYKYADALVKCFASAVSTGILLYLAPLIFNVPLSFLIIPGSVTVFAATYLYIDNPAPKVEQAARWEKASTEADTNSLKGRIVRKLGALTPSGDLRHIGVSLSAAFALLICVGVVIWENARHSVAAEEIPVVRIESPFNKTLAYVRWNQELPTRIPTIMEYAPFFKEMHISMPGYGRNSRSDCTGAFDAECGNSLFNNLTADNYDGTYWIYTSIAHTMQGILDAPENSTEGALEGLLYFHFDAWVDPMAFQTEDLSKMWFPDGVEPRLECMTNVEEYGPWWAFTNSHHELKSINATEEIVSLLEPSLASRINPKEFCAGWSDIYYIPRRFFKDYIYLARIMYKHEVFHEVAVPTMIHIIDLMRRSNTMHRQEVLTHLSDCWGSCCMADPAPRDLLWHRCGHKLNLDNVTLSNTFFDRLSQDARRLGTPIYDATTEGRPLTEEIDSIFDPNQVAAILSQPVSYHKDKLISDEEMKLPPP